MSGELSNFVDKLITKHKSNCSEITEEILKDLIPASIWKDQEAVREYIARHQIELRVYYHDPYDIRELWKDGMKVGQFVESFQCGSFIFTYTPTES